MKYSKYSCMLMQNISRNPINKYLQLILKHVLGDNYSNLKLLQQTNKHDDKNTRNSLLEKLPAVYGQIYNDRMVCNSVV